MNDNQQPKTTKSSPIQDELDRANKNLLELIDYVTALETKLMPVLTPLEAPKPCAHEFDCAPKDKPSSSVASGIGSLRAGIASIANRINHLLVNTEL